MVRAKKIAARYIKGRLSQLSMDDHIAIMDFHSNPNIGLYAYTTDTYCLLGRGAVEPAKLAQLKKTLQVPIHEITLCGTSLIGVFCTGNKNGIIVPSIIFDYELEALQKLGIPVHVIETNSTALGNNVVVNDYGALVSPEIEEKARHKIASALGVQAFEMKIASLPIVGSVVVLRGNNALVHHDVEEFEKKMLESKLKVRAIEGSVNMGSPYVHSGIIVNTFGMCVGSASGGPEIDHIDHALGFIQD